MHALLIGHICLDLRNDLKLPGGPPQYQIPILIAMGVESIDVITSCADTNTLPNHPHLTIINIPSESTTTFSYTIIDPKDESEEDRELRLTSKAKNITSDDFKNCRDTYDCIIISGIAGEVNIDLITYLRENYTQARIFLDAQTFTRDFNIDGKAIITPLSNQMLDQLFKNGIIIKGSSIELPPLDQLHPSGVTIRTASGTFIEIYDEDYMKIKIDKIKEGIVDSTGSGDIFLASFAIQFCKTENMEYSINIAHQITKEHLYIQGIPSLKISNTIINRILNSS